MPSAQVYAQNATLDQAIQNLQFALTVEWDQKDSNFRNEVMKQFQIEVTKLEKSGMTREQILTELKTKVLDSRTAADLDKVIQLSKDQKVSKEEIRKIVTSNIERSQRTGASWQGDSAGTVIAAVVIVAIVVLIIVAASNSRSTTVYVDDGYYYDDNYYYDDDYYYYDCYWDSFWEEYVCY